LDEWRTASDERGERLKLLVTGGAGYIGSVVSARLIQSGHDVIVLDDLSKGRLQAVPKGAQFVRGDVSNYAALQALFQKHKFDGVLHFAAFIEAGESMKLPQKYFRNNSANTLTLLEVMLEHDVRRFVFSSTAALYGNPKRIPIEEHDVLDPTNAYGESKLLVERMLDWFHRIHGLRSASLRYFNAAGATADLGEDHKPESHLIPIVLQVALGQRENVAIYGTDYPTQDGTCVRDYIHVEDLASAHLLAIEALGKASEPGRRIYNLGNGRGFSVLEVIEASRRVTGHAIPVVKSPRRDGDSAVLVASSDKIRRELKWQPQHADLEAIIRSAWEWRRKHPQGYGE
jgi:UDP-glucose 4-epimerase